ncbi:MAG TPA: hypothetical protein VNX68_17685, partial [Nitrosopumilaceae archaeon]|nr:hypothetical protein [Nitrosopumilaceae archaeon]
MEKYLTKVVMLRFFDKIVVLTLMMLLFASPFNGQITSHQDKKLLFKADNAFDYGDYLAALKIYQTLYPLDSNGHEINYKIGVCYFEIKKMRGDSKRYFEKTSISRFPETNYYLGMVNHLLNKL